MVAVAVIRGSRGVLIGRRADGVPLWVFLGGKAEAGETPEQTAVREAAEEAGVVVEAVGEIGRRTHPRTGRLMVYVDCTATDDTATVAAPDELAEVRWAGVSELDELMPDLFGPVRDHLGRSC